MNNIFIKLETLGTTSNSIIISISAVKFEFGSGNHEVFTAKLDPKSSKKYGMISDPATVAWWKENRPEQLKDILSNNSPIDEVLDGLSDFIGSNWIDMVVWAQSCSFDISILEWSYRATGRNVPWKFWNQRDTRTIFSICDLDLKSYPKIVKYKNGIDDCLTQIKALKECLA